MAARQCILTLASIHTTAMTVSNIIYDLCAHPEWIPEMVEEVDDVYNRLAKPGAKWGEKSNSGITTKDWCALLQKIDSLFVESQRLNPVILRKYHPEGTMTDTLHGYSEENTLTRERGQVNPQRLAREDVTFKDGTHVPRGTRIAFPMGKHHYTESCLVKLFVRLISR